MLFIIRHKNKEVRAKHTEVEVEKVSGVRCAVMSTDDEQV